MEERDPEPTQGAREEAQAANERQHELPANLSAGWLILFELAERLAREKLEQEEAESRRAYRATLREERRRRRERQPAEINLRRLRCLARQIADGAEVLEDTLAEVHRQLEYLQHDAALLLRWLRLHGPEDPPE